MTDGNKAPLGRKHLSDEEYSRLIKQFEFAVVPFEYYLDGRRTVWYSVVFRHMETKLVLRFTRFEDLIAFDGRNNTIRIGTKNKTKATAIKTFLQGVFIDYYDGFRLRDIRDLSPEIVETWICIYATRITYKKTYPKDKSVLWHRNIICEFLYELCGVLKMRCLRRSDVLVKHHTKRKVGDGIYERPDVIYDYRIHARLRGTGEGLISLNRDMPFDILPVFLKIASVYDPELCFAIVLSAFMGLREGEICNVYDKYSIYGPGIICSYKMGKLDSFQLDLGKERTLRSDGKDKGDIKRERLQGAFEPFLPVIDYFLKKHMKLIADKKRESFGPLFVNKYKDSTGVYRAMTVDGYNKRIKKLFPRVLEYCRNSDNAELQEYYDLMITRRYTWGPHAFRHLYTILLVLHGCETEQIRELRGDHNPKSAQDYIKKKGVLLKEFRESNDVLGFFLKKFDEIEVN